MADITSLPDDQIYVVKDGEWMGKTTKHRDLSMLITRCPIAPLPFPGSWGFFMEVLMNICVVDRDLNNHLAELEAEELEQERLAEVGERLIAEFRREGCCRIQTGPRQADFEDYDQSHLLERLFDHEHADLVTEAFRHALDTSLTDLQRLQAANKFFEMAGLQMEADLYEMAEKEYIDDEYCP